jgi:hypothetical protein
MELECINFSRLPHCIIHLLWIARTYTKRYSNVVVPMTDRRRRTFLRVSILLAV